MRPYVCALAVALVISSPAAADVPHFADAPLRAVRFVDENEGWAVGDEGAIWHTIDGGLNWERQPSGTRASLRSLWFVDPFTGYVVGTESLPQRSGSAGVVLFTRDGGVKWQRLISRELPGLCAVKFFDRKNGFIVGDGSDQFPSGVFATADGGAAWKPLEGPRAAGWRAADFLSPQLGVAAGAWGSLTSLKQQTLSPAAIDLLHRRTVRAVQYAGTQAVAAGDGGLALVCADPATARWETLTGRLPAVAQACDFHALSFAGDHGWLAGRPGSVVLHTPDRGKTWQVQHTGQTLPLHGLFFLDGKRGWAVGELGTILATADGGATWKPQRRGGHRVGVLCVNARPEELPAGTIAVLGGDADEGYLVAALRVTSPDPVSAAPHRAGDEARFAEAVRLAGGCGAETLWQFPLPEHLALAAPADLARAWGGSQGESRGIEELERQLTLALRIWRPDVVIADDPDSRAPSGQLGTVVTGALRKACDLAGKAEAFPEQISQLGLQPWSSSKLYVAWPTGVALDLLAPRPGLLASAQDRCAATLGLLGDPPMPSPACYRLLAGTAPNADKQRWFMDGLSLEFGGQARREKWSVDDAGWAQIQKAARQRRDLLAVAKLSATDAVRAQQLLGQVDKALTGLTDDQAGETAYALAQMYVHMGQWLLAKEVFLLLVDRYPAHRRTAAACQWLIQFTTSAEARRREELKNFCTTSAYQFQAAPDPEAAVAAVGLRGSQQTMLMRRQDEVRQWNQAAFVIADVLVAQGSVFAADPSVQFALQAARRVTGKGDEATQWYSRYQSHRQGQTYGDAAAAELWLQRRIGICPKATATCVRTPGRPYLDGKLDEACWKDVKPTVLQDAVGKTAEQFPTEAWLAYDNEFLYLALRCKHPAGRQLPPAKNRRHDEDLRPFDRVSLLLDLDRDYATYFQFQIDQRGCVSEDCWGDKRWDPKWYVAIHSEETVWQIEAAIPLAELAAERPSAGQAWCVNVVRTIPGHGVQALSLPADVSPRPEGMGLLLFADEPPK